MNNTDQANPFSLSVPAMMLLLLLSHFFVSCAPTTRSAPINDELVAAEARIQRKIALQTFHKQNLRLQKTAHLILTGAAPLCKERVVPTLGFQLASRNSFAKEFQEAATSIFNLDDRVHIIGIYPESPAASAGLQAGDVLLEVNGRPIPADSESENTLAGLFADNLEAESPLEIIVERNNVRQTTTITPVMACGYPVHLGSSDEINAHADGQRIVVNRGMLRFIETDQELTLLISHELAHNVMGHTSSQKGNYLLGSILDLAIGITTGISTQGLFGAAGVRMYSKEFEAEADYVGLYMMANAGFDLDGAAHFWRRLAASHPDNITRKPMSTHPSPPERFVAIEATVSEINTKKQKKLPLMPESKTKKKQPNQDLFAPEP